MGNAGDITDVVARELRALLARRRLTHAQLARMAGMPPSTVNRALRGATAITLDNFVPIVAALNDVDQDRIIRALVAMIRAQAHADGENLS